jgi:hypothetical protein
MRVVLGDTLDEFGFDHRGMDPGPFTAAISVKMP